VRKWWGPGGNDPVSRAELDLRVGGRFRIVFGGPDGKAHECAGIYREVVPNRKLVFTWTWPNSTPERESLVTISFRATPGGTELVGGTCWRRCHQAAPYDGVWFDFSK